MSTTELEVDEFVPYVSYLNDGHFYVKLRNTTDLYDVPWCDFINQQFYYMLDGVAVAIVRFKEGERKLDSAGNGLEFSAYFYNGDPHPEYFEGLTAIDVAKMYDNGTTLVYVMALAEHLQTWQVKHIPSGDRAEEQNYFVTSAADTAEGRFPGGTLVHYDPAVTSPVLSHEEVLALIANPPSGPEALLLNRAATEEVRRNWDWNKFVDDGGRLLIQNLTAMANFDDESNETPAA